MDEELLSEYLKALDLLTIGNEESLKEVQDLRIKAATIEELRATVAAQQKRIESIKAEVATILTTPETVPVKERIKATAKRLGLSRAQFKTLQEAAKIMEVLKTSDVPTEKIYADSSGEY